MNAGAERALSCRTGPTSVSGRIHLYFSQKIESYDYIRGNIVLSDFLLAI
jgi:hypothetical protein